MFVYHRFAVRLRDVEDLLAERRVAVVLSASGVLARFFFGGEGLSLLTLRDHGVLCLQSLPFARLAKRILACAPPRGGDKEGEIRIAQVTVVGVMLGVLVLVLLALLAPSALLWLLGSPVPMW